MNRREFNASALGIATSALVPKFVLGGSQTPKKPHWKQEAIHKFHFLHQKSVVGQMYRDLTNDKSYHGPKAPKVVKWNRYWDWIVTGRHRAPAIKMGDSVPLSVYMARARVERLKDKTYEETLAEAVKAMMVIRDRGAWDLTKSAVRFSGGLGGFVMRSDVGNRHGYKFKCENASELDILNEAFFRLEKRDEVTLHVFVHSKRLARWRQLSHDYPGHPFTAEGDFLWTADVHENPSGEELALLTSASHLGPEEAYLILDNKDEVDMQEGYSGILMNRILTRRNVGSSIEVMETGLMALARPSSLVIASFWGVT